jgi:IK cytokine
MDNSAFRNLLSQAKSKKTDSSSKPAAETSEARAARLAKQAERKAAYEKRMAVQAKRQEKLAEEAKYVDRAAQRRKELAKAGVSEEAPPLAGLEELMQLEEGPVVSKVPDGPTFAQVAGDGREDLAQQQHRLSIAQSKYLGGDIEHTHLVKGLDFALLQKRRAELVCAVL